MPRTVKKRDGNTGPGGERPGKPSARPFAPWIPDWAILVFFSILLVTQTLLSVREKSATFDETAHLPAGYVYWRLGDYGVNPEHPPLVKMLAALPLLFVDVKMPLLSPVVGPKTDFTFGSQFLYEENDGDRLLFLGRVAVLPLALSLGCAVFLWARHLFGREAAILSLLLYSFEPNVLANAPLVNTDLGAACFMFLTVYAFHRLVHQVSVSNLVLAGLSLGLAFIAKFSAPSLLLILLLLGLSVVVAPQCIELRFPGVSPGRVVGWAKKLSLLVAALAGMGLLTYGIIWAAYQFRYEGIRPLRQPSQFPWHQIQERPWITQAFTVLRQTKVLPESYLYGMAFAAQRLKRAGFLMGEISFDGWWHYFLVTFLLKTPLPLLLLLATTLFALYRLWRQNRVVVLFLLVPVLVYFGIASVGRLNIGHRHILPIYPFLLVMVGALVPWVKQQRLFVKGAVLALTAWFVVSSVAIFPHYLAYFNELAGGPQNGYKYLVDSNLDWGQDLKGLKRYMEAQGIPRVWFSYFGSASPDYYQIPHNLLPSYVIFNRRMDTQPASFVAISATNLQGVYFPTMGVDPDYFAQYRKRTPVAKIGFSIFVYRIQ